MGLKKGIPSIETALEPQVVIYRAADGGPTRFPVTGLKRNTTHYHIAGKAGNMLLPAESNHELAAMFLLDISTSVLSYMAQPHLLVFRKNGKKREYTPDLDAVVPFWFAEQLLNGIPFARAALKMPSARSAREPLVKIVLEVKRTMDDEPDEYKAKINAVANIYRRHGYFFFVLEEKRDLKAVNCSHLPSILMDRSVTVNENIIKLALDFLRRENGVTTYAAMMEVLGGGPLGRELTNYLHIIGLIWVDYTANPVSREDSTTVAMPPLLGPRRQAAARTSSRAA
jgi:hypothetical protein